MGAPIMIIHHEISLVKWGGLSDSDEAIVSAAKLHYTHTRLNGTRLAVIRLMSDGPWEHVSPESKFRRAKELPGELSAENGFHFAISVNKSRTPRFKISFVFGCVKS
ncbi:MAG: hypothetical protein GW775_02545 [Candidatus Magasanikbacteria bacterium]|nr:hypothetical protein [Candidatus Magasanikbacteria bacterium]